MIESTPLVGDPYEKRIETRTTVIRVHSRRVFKPRIWLGWALLRFGFWVMGAKGETIE